MCELLFSVKDNIVKWLSSSKWSLQSRFIALKTKLTMSEYPWYSSFHCLGVEIHDTVNWLANLYHAGNLICRKVFGLLRQLKPFALYKTLYVYIILSCFHCYSPLWYHILKKKLQRLENRPARIMTGANNNVR